MLIGILETGRPPEELKEKHGSYPDMFMQLLAAGNPDLRFRSFAAIDGEVPVDFHECDGWLITGSRHGAYEQLPWMLALEQLIRQSVAGKVPVAGICFGHQIMAQALGGKVVKSDKGWGIGFNEYEMKERADWMEEAPQRITLPAFHQDQVVELPRGAEVLASSPFCPYAVLAYDDAGFSIQAHPEFTEAYQRDLIASRRGTVVPEAVADKAVATFDGRLADTELVARWIGAFFRRHQGAEREAAA